MLAEDFSAARPSRKVCYWSLEEHQIRQQSPTQVQALIHVSLPWLSLSERRTSKMYRKRPRTIYSHCRSAVVINGVENYIVVTAVETFI